jgi:hypothetical protein
MKRTATISKYFLTGAAAVALTLTGCKKKEGCTDATAENYDAEAEVDNGTCAYPEVETVITVSSNITTSTTWETGKVYILAGRIAVTSGATLTIQPGVIVKGQAGTGANATALLIARGAKLNAIGTATQPIIFTSVADEIMPGQIASPNMPTTLNGLWGGLLILGNAPISAAATSVQIEGIPASDANGLYGGTDAADNSGTIRYVSIRHGGANIGDGNEINGLTLGGVGSGTTIDHIEVISNQDDGVEFFGGTVNVTDVLVWNAGDDAIDTDQAWAGSLSNFIVISGDATDHSLEIDGPEGALLAGHTVSNGSIKGNDATELGDFRSSARGAFSNLWFFGNTDPSVDGRGDLSLSSGSDVTFGAGTLTFATMQYDSTGTNVTVLTSVFKGGTDAHAAFTTTPTVGATKSAFASWTWADVEGELTDF